MERMSVRAKYMAMDPSSNKYVRNMRNIRTIQDYLVRSAEKVKVPKLSNSNVDFSVSAIHATLLAILSRCEASENECEHSDVVDSQMAHLTLAMQRVKQSYALWFVAVLSRACRRFGGTAFCIGIMNLPVIFSSSSSNMQGKHRSSELF